MTTIATTALAIAATVSLRDFQTDTLWILIAGFIIAFGLAFAVGANDVANSFGTTVGAKTLTLRQACILASIFESLGAVLLGAKVGETIRKGIIDPEIYVGNEKTLMIGQVSAMIGSVLWQLFATFFKMPVSGTHSIVGAMVGFSIVSVGFHAVNWTVIGMIVASWFASPLLAGIMVSLFYSVLKKLIFEKENAIRPGLLAMPLLYSCTLLINTFSILHSGSHLFGDGGIPVWVEFIVPFLVAILVFTAVQLIVVPRFRRRLNRKKRRSLSDDEKKVFECAEEVAIPCQKSDRKKKLPYEEKECGKGSMYDGGSGYEADNEDLANGEKLSLNPSGFESIDDYSLEEKSEIMDTKMSSRNDDIVNVMGSDSLKDDIEGGKSKKDLTVEENDKEDRSEIRQIFSFLQILTACFGAFAHGGNDVSNAIGPLIALYIIFSDGSVMQEAMTPIWLLVFGGVGISVGLWVWGRKVIKTLGEDLTALNPSRGFAIELMSAVTVLGASNIGIPVSTTHCKIGAVVAVGLIQSKKAVNWKIFGNIVIAWFVTVPVSGGLSALVFFIFKSIMGL